MRKDPSTVDRFLEAHFTIGDEIMAAIADRSRAAGLADIAVSPLQGKFLMILAAACGARRILEIGALGGYSTVWLARAAGADGKVVSLEIDPRAASVARDNARRAGVDAVVEIVEGPASQSLAGLSGGESFDFAFIDADKEGYPDYLDLVVPLMRRGGLVVADNVVRDGAVADESSADPRVVGVQDYLRRAADHPRLETTVLQTVGMKGHDGFAVSRVGARPTS